MAKHIMVDASEATRTNFMNIIQPHLGLLKQSALKYCNWDEALAEDMLQETLMKGYAKIDSFGGGNFGGWMYRILHNTIVDTFRRRHGEVNIGIGGDPYAKCKADDGFDVKLDVSPSWIDGLLTLDNQSDFLALDKIKQSIEELPTNMKRVFKMAILDGLEYKQVAKILKMPIGTVMSQIYRSRMFLQRKLKSMVTDD